MKKKLVILSVVIVAIAIVIFIIISNQSLQTRYSIALVENQEIEKLFTGFAYIPIIQKDRGALKRTLGLGDSVLLGYCVKEYEVGIGYEDVMKIIAEYHDLICDSSNYTLPEPVIISTNPVISESYGSFDRIKCDNIDKEIDGKRKSWELIKEELIKSGNWAQMVNNSRKILTAFIKIYCEY